MFEVRVESEFSAAHFLRDYHGKCENLHGHNYAVFAHARARELDAGGMALDFGELKAELRSVCNSLDHRNLNELQDAEGNLVFGHNPSAERIARHIFDRLVEAFAARGEDLLRGRARLFAVDVFETPTSRARYLAEG